MKRLLLFVLITSLFTLPVQAADCPGSIYSDAGENCPEEEYFYWDDIEMLTEEGIFTGNADGTFAPSTGMNRAEFATLLKRLSRQEPTQWDAYNQSCFTDIEQGQWFTENVCFSEEQGWFQGYDDGTFGFSRNINRAEAIKTVVEMLNLDLLSNGSMPYDDVPSDAWYATYVLTAEQAGLLEENMDLYRPGDDMTREEIAYILARSFEYIEEVGVDMSSNFNVIEDDEWIFYESAISYLNYMYPSFGGDYEYYRIIQHPTNPDIYFFAADDTEFGVDGNNHILIFEYDTREYTLTPIWEATYGVNDFVEIGGESYSEAYPAITVNGYSNDALALFYQYRDDSPGYCFDPLLIGEDYPYSGSRGFVALELNTEDAETMYLYSPEIGEAMAIPSDVQNQAESEYSACMGQ